MIYDELEKEARQLADFEQPVDGDLCDDSNDWACAEFITKLDKAVEAGDIDMVEKSQLLDILG